ncbi:unnamed protein product [Ceratitis capitata]|uniref:(Mediterranean fruit fly) hypothetical protein n=1 Tax=Ceratitis capitata TaxID=7213 RepID=A0A811UHN8_CERCA|nr:unnamed protein product [Ceratitis capitata]
MEYKTSLLQNSHAVLMRGSVGVCEEGATVVCIHLRIAVRMTSLRSTSFLACYFNASISAHIENNKKKESDEPTGEQSPSFHDFASYRDIAKEGERLTHSKA